MLALDKFGARSIRVFDPEPGRAAILTTDMAANTRAEVVVATSADEAASGVDGLLNCSPIGMFGHPGCPAEPDVFDGLRWVFDAVDSPLLTEFLNTAGRAGAT